MRDYYRRTLIDRWDDLLELSPNAQRVYFYAFAGPTSTAYGLSLIHAGRTRRDLGITKVELQGALVELAQSGCVQFDEVKASRYVLCDPDLAATIAPKDPNNKIAAAKRCAHVPPCDTQRHWLQSMGIGAQLPESTGNRGASPSQALAKPSPSKKKNEKKNENENHRSDPSDLHRAAWAAWQSHLGSDSRTKQHRTKDGLPQSKELRAVLSSFVNSDRARDFDAYFAYLASVQPWDWFDGTFAVNIEWATRPATRKKVAAEGYQQAKPADKGPQKPRHVQMHEGAWFDQQGGYWRTQTGYPIDQWGKPDYGAKVRFEPKPQGDLQW